MQVAVIGAGVVGVTTAWELCEDGHEVTVFERRDSVAAESSFAPGGLVSAGWSAPWAAPASPFALFGRLLSRRHPEHPSWRADISTLRWLWRWWRATGRGRGGDMRLPLLRLAEYSRERLRQLVHDAHLDYERADGCLVLLRGDREVKRARATLGLLAEAGLRFSLVDGAHCRSIEPGLNPDTPLIAGVHLPEDESGNPRLFTHQLRTHAQRRGVRFVYQCGVRKIRAGTRPELEYLYGTGPEPGPAARDPTARADGGPVTAPLPQEVRTESFDAVVLCSALGAPALLRPLGLRLPLMPVWGHSVTAPSRHFEAHPDAGPRAAIIDARHDTSIARLGQRVRIAGGTALRTAAADETARSIEALYRIFDDWFPGTAQLAQALHWTGARSSFPEARPWLGASGLAGIWLNLGHGGHGWALACGCARLLADGLAGRPLPETLAGLDLARSRR